MARSEDRLVKQAVRHIHGHRSEGDLLMDAPRCELGTATKGCCRQGCMTPTGTCTQNDPRDEMEKSCEEFDHETLIVTLIRGDSGREIDNRLRTASFGRAPYKYRLQMCSLQAGRWLTLT